MTKLTDEFTRMFRGEHREIRDALLDLAEAFAARDRSRIGSLLNQTAALTGPHFRYEEEALYPGLVEIFGPDYIEKLLGDHDVAIATARKLVELAGQESLSDRDVRTAIAYVRSILPHVSDCDGLSIMVERLPERKVQAVFDARDRSRAAGIDLLQWAAQVRQRPAVVPSAAGVQGGGAV
jgi:hypothetical protein